MSGSEDKSKKKKTDDTSAESGKSSNKSDGKKDSRDKPSKKEPEKPEKNDKADKETSTGKMIALGLIVLFFTAAVGFYLYYFHGGGREFLKQKYAKEIIPVKNIDENKENENREKAIQLVKELKGKETYMTVASRLEFYKNAKEKESKEKIIVGSWRVIPSAGKQEVGRYYDVFHDWKIKDAKVTYVWLVDLKNAEVTPSSDFAKELEDYDKVIYSSIPGRDTAATPPQLSPSPGDKDKTDEKPALTPLGKSRGDVQIVPPENVGTDSPSDINSIPEEPETGMDFSGTGSIQLRGFLSSGGTKKAIILDGSSYKEVQAGADLSGGWKVSNVGKETITISNGSSVKTLKVSTAVPPKSGGSSTRYEPAYSSGYSGSGDYKKANYPKAGEYTGGNYPRAGEYSGSGNYPKAGDMNVPSYPTAGEATSGNYPQANPPSSGNTPRIQPGKPPAGGPPVIPAPGSGDAPPIPPPPGKSGSKSTEIPMPNNAPKDEPTIIPLD